MRCRGMKNVAIDEDENMFIRIVDIRKQFEIEKVKGC